MTALWTHEQQAAAQAEGWDIFEAEGSMFNENGDAPFQLQKIDEADKFDDDSEVSRHVVAATKAGSALHVAALVFLQEQSPKEFVWVTTQ